MHIFIAGASGVLGSRVAPLLLSGGDDVTGTTRAAERAEALAQTGVRPVVVDAYDPAALEQAVRAARPDVLLHLLTDLGAGSSDANARMRIEGTRNLVAAAQAAGVRRIVAQSIAWAYAPGSGPADEATPLDLGAAAPRSRTIEGVVGLETAVAALPEALVLRCGVFYGPGTWYSDRGFVADKLRRGEPVTSAGITSFVHVDDAAAATALAVAGPTGALNVVDDEPAPGADWSALFAAVIGAPTPGELAPGEPFERGADNRAAKAALGWRPRHASWRDGFPDALRAPGA